MGISDLTQLKESHEFRKEGRPDTKVRHKKPEILKKTAQRQGMSTDFLTNRSSLSVTKLFHF
jgi:hypothetical protein